MFQENKEFKNKIEKEGNIHFIMPNKWKSAEKLYAFTPRDIKVTFGTAPINVDSAPTIFICYFTKEGSTLKVSHLQPSRDFSIINDRTRALIDAYLNKVIKEIIRHARLLAATKIIIESTIPMIADSFLELGFEAKTKGDLYVGERKI